MRQWLIVLALVLSMGSVLGADPTVGAVSAPSSIALSAGTTQTITCNATIKDTDGYQNITNVNATFFDPGEASGSSSDDNNNHYTNSSCTLSGGSGNTTNAVCGIDLWYYANAASDWECVINATDGTGSGGNTTGQTITVQQLKALSVTSLNYTSSGSSINLGTVSDEETLNITNTGNVNITVDVSGGSEALSCDIGTVPLGNERYNTTSGFAFAGGVNLTGTATNVSNFVVAQRTDDASPSVNYIYWLLKMPDDGVGGGCTGSITVNAN